jgi:hypothetical protein
MSDAVELAKLLKDYGLVAVLAVSWVALGWVVKWLRDSMAERLSDKDKMVERIAVALERQASTNQDQTEATKEMRDGQSEILKTVTEAALTSAAKQQTILEKIGETRNDVNRARGVSA